LCIFWLRTISNEEFYTQTNNQPLSCMTREDPSNRSSASPCESWEAIEWGSPSNETGKTETPCPSRCGTIKIPPCSKALSAEQRP
jgi:hypothetical protein